MSRISWQEYFRRVSENIALRSPDTHKQVGAVIVDSKNRIIATGYNGLPRGVDESVVDWNNREKARELVIHAECNAILSMNDIYKDGKLVLYSTLSPCPECIKLIKTAGITKVFFIEKYRKYEEAKNICDIFGIEIHQLKKDE